MRFEFCSHVASSMTRFVSLLQEVVDDADLKNLQQHAQGGHATPNLLGCVDSPEAATLVLMVVGAVGIYYGSVLFARRNRRRAAAPLGL